MKQIFVFILLLSHINSTMFFPVVDEDEQHNPNSKPVDEINSVYEYVDEVVLGNKDDTPGDDENQTHFYHIEKIAAVNYVQQVKTIEMPEAGKDKIENTRLIVSTKIVCPVLDVSTPPPDSVV